MNAMSGAATHLTITPPPPTARGLVAALVAAQAELPTALGKDSDGQIGTRTYRYLALERGPKRRRRHKARPLDWLVIRAAKFGPCRVRVLGGCEGRIELHHIVPRAWGGDDVADNIAPLCTHHHAAITSPPVRQSLSVNLTDDEYAYIVQKLGAGGMERLFGIEYQAPLDAA